MRVQRLAAALADLGITPGDAVAVLDTNSSRYLETYFATSMLGAVFVPLNYRAQADELAYMILTAGVRMLMVGDRYGALVSGIRDRLRCVIRHRVTTPQMMLFEELIAQSPGEASEAEVDEADINILMYTSGTTGRPKGSC